MKKESIMDMARNLRAIMSIKDIGIMINITVKGAYTLTREVIFMTVPGNTARYTESEK